MSHHNEIDQQVNNLQKKGAKRDRKAKLKREPVLKRINVINKLVSLSKKVLVQLNLLGETTGTEIAYQILDMLEKEKQQPIDFKNVQRRVYDALNVFSALNIVHKNKNKISLCPPSDQEEEEKGSQIKNSAISSRKILENTTKICQEIQGLREKIATRKQAVEDKKTALKEKINQLFTLFLVFISVNLNILAKF